MTLDVDEHGFLGWLLEWWTRYGVAIWNGL